MVDVPNGSYKYSIANDFGGKLKSEQLQEEINASAIVTTLSYINTEDDEVDIRFIEEISAQDLVILDNLVSNHLPTVSKTNYSSATPTISKIKESTYSICGSFNYDPNIMGVLNSMDIVSRCDDKIDEYYFRLVNINNDKIIFEAGPYSNQKFENIEINNLSNIPTVSSILELHVKADGSKKKKDEAVTINSILFFHGNK